MTPGKNHEGEYGFTMIELLTSLSIIVLLLLSYLANYRTSNQQAALNMSAYEMVSNFRIAQNNSLGLASHDGSKARGGWGIALSKAENRKYILFADRDDVSNHSYSGANETSFEYKLSSNVIIKDILDSSGGSHGGASVVFMPPDPTVFIRYDNGVYDQATSTTVILEESASKRTKKVTINYFGLVDSSD